MIYHHSAKRTLKGETTSQLKQLAKDYYNITEDQLIKE
jgi:hypothetical protein